MGVRPGAQRPGMNRPIFGGATPPTTPFGGGPTTANPLVKRLEGQQTPLPTGQQFNPGNTGQLPPGARIAGGNWFDAQGNLLQFNPQTGIWGVAPPAPPPAPPSAPMPAPIFGDNGGGGGSTDAP